MPPLRRKTASIKIAEGWRVYFDKYRDHKYGVARSRDLATCEDISDPLVVPPSIRHGTVLRVTCALVKGLKQGGGRASGAWQASISPACDADEMASQVAADAAKCAGRIRLGKSSWRPAGRQRERQDGICGSRPR